MNLMLGSALVLIAFRALGVSGRDSAALQKTSRGDVQAGFPILRSAALFFFVLGIGLGNHLTLALFPIALALSRPIRFARILSKKGVALVALFFLAFGLLVYLYLPVRANEKPLLNWDNPSTWERFWGHVSQTDYKFKQASRTFDENVAVTRSYFTSIWTQLGPCGAVLALFGLIWGLMRMRSWILFFPLLMLGTLLVTLLYGEGESLEPAYCLPAYLAAAILAGIGVGGLLRLVTGARSSESARLRRKLALAVFILLAVLPLHLAAKNYHSCNSSGNYYAYWHGHNMLRTMPLDSTFFGETDTALFPLYYMKFVEGLREDVRLYERRWRVVEYFEQNDAQSNYNREMRIIESAMAPVFYAEYPTVPAINIKLFGILLEAFMVEPLTPTMDFPALYSTFLDDPPADVYVDRWTQETRAKYFLLWGHQAQLLGDRPSAKARFERASLLGFHNAGLMNNLSIYHQQAGMGAEAIADMERAIELQPRNPRFLSRLGILYFRAEQLDRAVSILEQSLSLDPENPDATIYLGNAFMLKADLEQAEKCFARTIELMPHHVYAHNNLGFILKKQGRFDEAIGHFKVAMGAAPKSELPYFNLASAYSLQGDKKSALKWLKRGRRYMSSKFVKTIRDSEEFDNIRDDPRFGEILSIGN